MSAVRPEDPLHFRLAAFRAKVARAEQVVANGLRTMQHPYVAFSGGKDSTVVLALVRRQCPHVPVVWCDDELEHDETAHFVTREGGDALTVVAGHARHAGWFDPWRLSPSWRAPLAGMLPIGERVEPWASKAGYDGCFVGLRADEQPERRISLATRGTLSETKRGWRCNPIAWWSANDVWAFLAGTETPYNPVYDALAAASVPRENQRVGPLPLCPGWILRTTWPDLYHCLNDRYGNQWGG